MESKTERKGRLRKAAEDAIERAIETGGVGRNKRSALRRSGAKKPRDCLLSDFPLRLLAR